MSAAMDHAQQLNRGVQVEEDFDEIYVLLFEEGWESKTVVPSVRKIIHIIWIVIRIVE